MAVVVGFVPTPEGRAALERGLTEAKLRGLRLEVVDSHRGGGSYDVDEARKIEAELEDFAARLRDEGVEHNVRSFVRGNDPSEDLVSVAEESEAELIVIGLRRRTPVGKLLLGSNAQQILLNADCPVLAVKAPKSDPE